MTNLLAPAGMWIVHLSVITAIRVWLLTLAFGLSALVACAGESDAGSIDADAAFALAKLTAGNRIHYAAVEYDEDAAIRATDEANPNCSAVAVADARVDFILRFPDDSRCWLVASYLFLPPTNLGVIERVHYLRTIRKRLTQIRTMSHLPEQQQNLLLVVEAFHELGKLDHQVSFRPSTITRSSFAGLESMLKTLHARAAHDSSVNLLTNYHAELLARATQHRTEEQNIPTAEVQQPTVPRIDSTEIDLILRMRWPREVAGLHTRWSSDRAVYGLPPWTAIMLQEQKDRDALLRLEVFFRQYPGDARMPSLVYTYLFITPDFIASYPAKPTTVDWVKGFQDLPRDQEAKRNWLQTGNDMVSTLLASPQVSEVDKESLPAQQLFRDLRNAALGWEPKPDWATLLQRLTDCVSRTKNPDLLVQRMRSSLEILRLANKPVREDYYRFLRESPDARVRRMFSEIETAQLLESLDQKLGQVKFISLQGDPINLAAYRGKVVLVDFWATWCTPCVAEMPNVKVVLDKYRPYGFEVIGISGDLAPRERVQAFLAERHFDWPQHYDGKGTENKFARLFSVSAWPTNYLVGRNGKIVAVNISGKALEPAVRKELGLYQ